MGSSIRDGRDRWGQGRSGISRGRVHPRLLPRAALVLVLGLAAAGCAPGPSPTAAPPTADGQGVVRFAEHGLLFDYPAAWRVFRYQVISSFTNVIAYLATVEVADPCTRTASTVTCGRGYRLEPGRIVVTVSNEAFPSFHILDVPPGAEPMDIGGLPGYLAVTGPDAEAGTDTTLTWTIAMPGSIDNYYSIRAEILGPGGDALEAQARALVASLRYDPPVPPLPAGPGAAELAAATALGVMATQSPTWACFPPSGSREARVSALTAGPELAVPQLATCTTEIEATRLQLWRLHLTLRLPTADPQAGLGEDIVIWVGADGSPGTSTSAALTP